MPLTVTPMVRCPVTRSPPERRCGWRSRRRAAGKRSGRGDRLGEERLTIRPAWGREGGGRRGRAGEGGVNDPPGGGERREIAGPPREISGRPAAPRRRRSP